MNQENLVEVTRNYYDSSDADEFYFTIWGGEDIHVGIYQSESDTIFEASRRTVEVMLKKVNGLSDDAAILDIGSGYGGAARQIARSMGCKVTCLNLSETENERNRQKIKESNLDKLIEVTQGNFEQLPFKGGSFEVVWCQDSILHSNNKPAVIQEVSRVLKPKGTFIFTDPMQSDDCPDGVLDPILERIHLQEMGSVKVYRELAKKYNLTEVSVDEMPEQLVNHYSSVLHELTEKETELRNVCSEDYIQRMKKGLNHWVEGGKNGYLNWGIMQFQKQ